MTRYPTREASDSGEGEMERAFFLIWHVLLWPVVPALFTVEVSQRSYQAEFGGTVMMECKFPLGDSEQNLSVFWSRIQPGLSMEVYQLENGLEDLTFQDPHYHGRVRLLQEELKKGRAVLQISNLRINDSGMYQCLLERGGADYKQTALTVRAPYKSINKILKTSGEEVHLSCDSQGYPLATVVWTDLTGRNITNESNATIATNTNNLFQITSTVLVKSLNNTYTCTFVREGLVDQSAHFHIPDDIPKEMNGRSSLVPLMFVIIFGIISVCVGTVVYLRYKGKKQHMIGATRDFLLEGYTPACLTKETTVEIQVNKEGDNGVENLRAVLRSRYARFESDAVVLEHHGNYYDKVLLQHLRNRDGSPVEATALLPDVGESRLLEGEPKSGKTRAVLAMACSWAQNTMQDPFGVTLCQLVVLVSCEGVTSDLFQEVMTQLGLDAELTVSSLQEILTGPVDTLLILDGYKFGNRDLDESLRKFLEGRQACRVLVTALPGQCTNLGEFFQTVLVLSRDSAESHEALLT
ncbi:hypothetical protein GJAV_G00041110 [Gymnothorax javanicus]|nr:hypothetical protein GJAV_G00041110 [Gymnothorax javanicus]